MMSVEKIRRARAAYWDARWRVGYGSKILNRHLHQILNLPRLLCLLLASGCATATITPTVRAPAGLPRPDRVLVHDFEVANADSDLNSDPAATVAGTGTKARTEEEMRVGKSVAKMLTGTLVEELRGRGIDAQRATEAAPPQMNTLSIRGRFLWGDKDDGTMRARIWFYQGTGFNLRLQAQGDATIRSDLKREAVASEAYLAAQDSDARRMARELAERVARYYREQGWIKS